LMSSHGGEIVCIFLGKRVGIKEEEEEEEE
jgi:hypothetical protein